MENLDLLKTRLAREKRARMAAEALLEEKAAELYEANQRLEMFAKAKAQEADTATEHKRLAQRRLWEALEAMPAGFCVFDRQHNLVVANAAYHRPYAMTTLSFDVG